MDTLTTTKTVAFAEIENLEQGNYHVVACDDPKCIFKRLTDTEGVILILNRHPAYGYNLFNKMQTTTYFHDEMQSHYYSSNAKKINVLVENDLILEACREDKNVRNIALQMRSKNSELKAQLNLYQKKGKFVREKGNFVNFFGCNFPLEWFLSVQRPSKFSEIYEGYNSIVYALKNRLPFSADLSAYNVLIDSYVPAGMIGDRYVPSPKASGISKTIAKVQQFFPSIPNSLGKILFIAMADSSYRTIENVRVSVVFNRLFDVDTQEDFLKTIDSLSNAFLEMQGTSDLVASLFTKAMESLPEARDIKKAAIKRKSTGAFNKVMDDLDFVKIDKETCPLTYESVYGGEIPIGTFFRKSGESYFVYNDNWELWEEMLSQHPEVAKQIAASASGRTTYEKDIMSYFYFVLHSLPEYLERHTGKKWKGIPRLVNSADELEPPKEGSTGTAKTRSALTPIVDNENSTVTVPYVSMQIAGYGTTYCYGLNYSVLEKGFSFNGNVITKDIEKQLNGRDDYGLMFYTLTGTAQGRGYPTFLIIFERLEKNTRVHFHRTHPMRSKGGDYNPIHNWTIGCYKWMIGNVNFEKIKAQQGDLAFVSTENLDFTGAEKVNSYDSHMFSQPVEFLPYTKKDKQNVLGYVRIPEPGVFLDHTEHMKRGILPGDYEIRQCRSWEANPKGIWSLRID
jgi:hypothetical protein